MEEKIKEFVDDANTLNDEAVLNVAYFLRDVMYDSERLFYQLCEWGNDTFREFAASVQMGVAAFEAVACSRGLMEEDERSCVETSLNSIADNFASELS